MKQNHLNILKIEPICIEKDEKLKKLKKGQQYNQRKAKKTD